MSGLAWIITSDAIVKLKEVTKGYTSDDTVATYTFYLFFIFV
jgi:hypothetical protein